MDNRIETGARPARVLRGVLWISLALNLVFVGLAAGAAFSGRWDKGPRSFNFAGGPFAQALSPQDRKAMRERLRTRSADIGHTRETLSRRQDALLIALRADTFDATPIEEFLAQMSERGAALQNAAQLALVAQIQSMDAVTRRNFADRLERELEKRPDRRPRP